MRKTKCLKRLAVLTVLGTMFTALLAGPISALTITSAPISTTVAPVAPVAKPQASETVTVGKKVTEVHYGSHFSSTVIGNVEDGTEVKILRSKGSFYQVDCFDMKGYIAKSQIEQREDGKYYVNCKDNSDETRYLPTVRAQDVVETRSNLRSKAMTLKGIRYVLGGTSTRGFDCSGFVQYVYRHIGYDLNRTAVHQLQDGVVIAREDMQVGDLVFFDDTTNNGRIATHVGIYIGNNKMIHAGASRGVVVADLSTTYYVRHYLCSRRVILFDSESTGAFASIGATQDINSSYWRNNSQA